MSTSNTISKIGLHAADRSADDKIPDGIFLVQVQIVR